MKKQLLPKIAVLMSTYNGEKFFAEQIDTILAQKDVDLHLYIRDDGSKDNTLIIIRQYCKRHDNITLIPSYENLGPGTSFIELLYTVAKNEPKYDYYAFADQDDIWFENKLIKGIEKINCCVEPCLYCSNQTIYENGIVKGLRHLEEPDLTFIYHLRQNDIAGCTFILNKKLVEFIIQSDYPDKDFLSKCRCHDSWIFLIAKMAGNVIYDKESYMYYRIHCNNVVGIGNKDNFVIKLFKYLKTNNFGNIRYKSAYWLLNCYPKMGQNIRNILNLIVSYKQNLKSRFKLLKSGYHKLWHENFFTFFMKQLLSMI